MKNIKLEELTKTRKEILEIANECAKDIKNYEEQTQNIVEPEVRNFLLRMYLYGLENNLSKEQVLEMYQKQLLK